MEEQYRVQAIEVIKQILHELHKENFTGVFSCVDESKVTDMDLLSECVQGTLELNDFSGIDEYGVPCNFAPPYEFKQLNFYEYKNGSGFSAEYQMTSDSTLVDLVLQVEFLYSENGLKSVFLGVDPQ